MIKINIATGTHYELVDHLLSSTDSRVYNAPPRTPANSFAG